MADFGKQNAHMCGLVQCKGIERHRPRNEERSPRGIVNIYSLPKQIDSIQVCKNFLLNTFGFSDGRVTRALMKLRECKTPGSDQRGNKPNPRAMPIEDINLVKQHIKNFPAYESQYTRAHNPNKNI